MGWPGKKIFGTDADPALINSRLVARNPVGRAASAPIEVHRHARNGKAPDAWLINQFCESANQAVLFRTKEVFRGASGIGQSALALPLSAAGSRPRWRFSFHTGPYTKRLNVVLVMHPQDSGFTSNAYTTVDILTTAGATASTASFYHGVSPTGSTAAFGFAYMKVGQQFMEGLTPDTDYTGVVTDVDYGRVVSCSIYELASLSENFTGYMPQNITGESAILDVYRENLSTITYNLWRRGAATVFNWTCDPQSSPSTSTSATPTNLLNAFHTTYGATVPGYDFVMTGKERRSKVGTGVPVRFCAYMDVPAANTGVVNLRNSAGASVIQISQAGAFTGWVQTTGVISSGKHYITHHRSAGAGTVSTYACGAYEYET